MTPEATEGPIDHLKISDAAKEEVLLKFFEKGAFTKKDAIKLSQIELTIDENYAFKDLLEKEEIIKLEKDTEEYYYLAEHYKPLKSYRKQVVMGLSIPILLFLILLITAGFVSIIYQLIVLFG
ncbi:MAG: hypothetical protein ACFFDW_08665 [Candidatus Thorarchaeota archaeon]